MAINREKYISKYVDEGLENVTLIETLIFDIKDGISVEEDLATLLRALHTLKGSSRMLEFKRIEELSHTLESVFIAVKEQRIALSEDAVNLVLASLDLLKSGLGVIQHSKDDAIEIQLYVKNLASLAVNEEYSLPKKDDAPVQKPAADPAGDEAQPAQANVAVKAENSEAPVYREGVNAAKPHKEAKSETIRLSLTKIDSIIKSIASLQSLEISAKSLLTAGSSLNGLIKEHAKLLKEDKKIDPSLAANFRKLERFGDRLNTSLKNFSVDAGNHMRVAYDSVISLRTLPLSTIFDNYPRLVHDLADEMGKKVHFSIEGKENEIDKNIIESLAEVLMHMVRNAIDHGIETPQDRLAAGKQEIGNLSINCSRESGNMKIIISDDGRGIDFEKIRQKAVKEGLVTESGAAALSKEDLTNFIFRNGFSTSGAISNISGRGVGMDVVRDNIEAMKGSIVIDSVWGKGTAFTLMVPLSIAALMGFPVMCGGMKFIIPANFVDTILLVNRDDIITVVDHPEIKYADRIIKLRYLSQILRIKTESSSYSDVVYVIIIRCYDDFSALAVDDISGMRSVILKNMPAFMKNMPVFSGIVLNEDYEMVSVLHIPTVIKMSKRIKGIDIKKHNVEFEKLRKSILVVDDSLPTREIESEILSAEGYLVDTAANGAQALRAAKAKHYDLICTDINMPEMDGFMLTENIKKNEELSRIPVIIISSMASEEDQRRAAMLGASRYIIKNSFNNYNLLEAVKDLIGKNGG